MQQEDTERELSIDELSQVTGIPSRTIRFYNTQGLLPPPHKRGRVAYYSGEHVRVLALIKELKEKHNLPLELIRQLLEIRAQHGEVQMNLALKQRLLRPLAASSQETRFSRELLLEQTGISPGLLDELLRLELLFPVQESEQVLFSGDDLLLVELYRRLMELGLPLALVTLIRFHLRQLVRSEIATFEQSLLPRWQSRGLPLEEQARQFEEILTLTDTLISILHRKLL
ncbi:MAG: MerR family transcriptional regulator [Thermogemmatispora sp.]|uniref:helix-turn-helix domain-containing protein n=1 Tax=Thermogemmatispora sp. TaxID=1968838 RepID=UPI002638C1EA|nr:helix-turn-helix domain-containing protein [Thermogemmatispora sp.]MBX5457643.1 MerR family transcriptional regulator [Thermogemmatispora sp.]